MPKSLKTILIAAHAVAAPLGAIAQDAAAPVVETASGPVRGMTAQGVEGFLGIPYAAPPVGELRWKAPQPAQAWAEPRDATAFGATCAAAESTNGPRSEAEDCLFVNVWRPEGLPADAKLPVYVFIHGGGFLNGSSNQADMAEIVAATGIIGVSLNYRLGALGFLAHPALTSESGESGNWGLMDQQAALAWVRDNIAAFGGDPARVTVGGESAGGFSTCVHLVAPGSQGLFAQALLQSAACPSMALPEAETVGNTIAEGLGCTGPDALECLRALPAGRLIDVVYPGGIPVPAHGTAFLPVAPREAIASGEFARVPVIVGATRDEGRTFQQGSIGWTEEDYGAWVRDTFGENADRVLEAYPWPEGADEHTGAYLSGAVVTDAGQIFGIGGCGNLALVRDFAAHVPTYAFEFAHRTGPGLTPDLGAYEWGAGHAAELAYLFPSFHNGTPIAPTFDEGEKRLAEEMKAYWGAFVTDGTPDPEGLAPWPAFGETGEVLSLRANGETAVVPAEEIEKQHNCAFWSGL